MILTFLLFILGFVLLVKGGDFFVDSSTQIARRFNIPELIIGATVVSIGTTLPEVTVSTQAALKGLGEIAYGNALGSIICNTCLIAALIIIIKPISVNRNSLFTPSLFFLVAALFYTFISIFSGYFSRAVGFTLVLIFIIYIGFTIYLEKKESTQVKEEVKKEKSSSFIKEIFYFVLGVICIYIGANLLINNGTEIAVFFGVPNSVIALTLVALGTSLPELVTAITALVKGYEDVSVGNIIGANLFNLVLVIGLSSFISPYRIPEPNYLFGLNLSLVFDLPVMLISMAILIIPTLIRGKFSRIQGIILFIIYIAFCTIQYLI